MRSKCIIDLRQGPELVNTGIVHEYVCTSKLGKRGVDQLPGFRRFADIRAHRFRRATVRLNATHDLFGFLRAARIVNYY